jgi:hypothetical protein
LKTTLPEMAVHHPFDRLVGHLPDAVEQILGMARMRAGVDQQHAVIGDEKDRVRAIVVEQEIEIVRDLLELDRRARASLRERRSGREHRARQQGHAEGEADAERTPRQAPFTLVFGNPSCRHHGRPPIVPAQAASALRTPSTIRSCVASSR